MFRADVAVLVVTLSVTVPLPLPAAPPVIVIQLTPSVAVHAQPAGAVTEKVVGPPDAPIDRLAGEIPNVHAAPAWSTLTVCPAIVSWLLRAAVALLAATFSVTVPLPIPAAPPAIVIQLAFSVAVHAQPVGAVTEKVTVPPLAPADRVAGATP